MICHQTYLSLLVFQFHEGVPKALEELFHILFGLFILLQHSLPLYSFLLLLLALLLRLHPAYLLSDGQFLHESSQVFLFDGRAVSTLAKFLLLGLVEPIDEV